MYGPVPAPAVAGVPADLARDMHAVFLGSAHITAGELIADRLLSPLEVSAILA